MKIKKKTAMLLSFAIGTAMFATTALAEVTSKSGYVQLKDAIKYTSGSLTEQASSFTVDMSMVLKNNDTVIASVSNLNKYDITKGARENTTVSFEGSKKREEYYYADRDVRIINNDDNKETYFVTEYSNQVVGKMFTDPFKEKQASDIERIADALIGNLKDYVVVSQNSDGSKELTGSLSEAQIPALINAVVSFQFKNSFGGYRAHRIGAEPGVMPSLSKDIFVKEVKGRAVVDKDGLIKTVLGSGVLSGKDDQNKEHNLSFELLIKIVDVNATIVNRPDLSSKKVEKSVQRNYDVITNPRMYEGTYKNNIVIEKDGRFEKIGERILDITSMDDRGITGRYREEYKEGYEEYAASTRNFSFTSEFMKDSPYYAIFNSTNTAGRNAEGSINISRHSAEIYFNFHEPVSRELMYDSRFGRVFD